MITAEKQRLRVEAGKILSRLGAGERSCGSQKIRAALESWECWEGIRTLCAYAALASEPDVLTPWPEGKAVLLPRMVGRRLVLHEIAGLAMLHRGAFGVLEPGEECPECDPKADVILVPGMAFDRSGARLGRGKGYYDRLLESFEGVRVGVCFEEQVVEAVPREPHDKRMQFLLTPAGLRACGT
jgi:5-formyltetrahydrofolate cyclo-ligase